MAVKHGDIAVDAKIEINRNDRLGFVKGQRPDLNLHGVSRKEVAVSCRIDF